MKLLLQHITTSIYVSCPSKKPLALSSPIKG